MIISLRNSSAEKKRERRSPLSPIDLNVSKGAHTSWKLLLNMKMCALLLLRVWTVSNFYQQWTMRCSLVNKHGAHCTHGVRMEGRTVDGECQSCSVLYWHSPTVHVCCLSSLHSARETFGTGTDYPRCVFIYFLFIKCVGVCVCFIFLKRKKKYFQLVSSG